MNQSKMLLLQYYLSLHYSFTITSATATGGGGGGGELREWEYETDQKSRRENNNNPGVVVSSTHLHWAIIRKLNWGESCQLLEGGEFCPGPGVKERKGIFFFEGE